MKKLILLFLLCVMPYLNTYAKSSPFVFTPRITNVTETSFTVMFKTASDALCWVEIAPDDGTVWYQTEHPKYYQDVTGRHFIGRDHSIEISGLKPGTPYRYRVLGKTVGLSVESTKVKYESNFAWNPEWGSGVRHARTCIVRTFDSSAPHCKFSMVNDIHFNDGRLRNLVSAMPEDSDFLLMNGDIVSHSQNIDSVVFHTFFPIKEKVSSVPVVYAKGNHEGRGNDWYKLPSQFPTPTGEFYYFFRHGPAAIIVLDAGEDKPDSDIEYYGTAAFDMYRAKELEWLKKAVQDPEFISAPQKICIIHIPTLSGKDSWASQKWICDNFTPLLEKAGIKLMLSGHHHRYILSKAGEDGSAYTVFVNSNIERADVEITASSIHVETHTVSGELLHSFDL